MHILYGSTFGWDLPFEASWPRSTQTTQLMKYERPSRLCRGFTKLVWVGGWNFEKHLYVHLNLVAWHSSYIYVYIYIFNAIIFIVLNIAPTKGFRYLYPDRPGRCLAHVSPKTPCFKVFAGNAPDGCIRVKDLEQALQVSQTVKETCLKGPEIETRWWLVLPTFG